MANREYGDNDGSKFEWWLCSIMAIAFIIAVRVKELILPRKQSIKR